MRFQPVAARSGPETESRVIDRAGATIEVFAPRHWTTARIDAWLDWAEALPADYPIAQAAPAETGSRRGRSIRCSWAALTDTPTGSPPGVKPLACSTTPPTPSISAPPCTI